ncbi:MAG: DUF5086 family protein [Gammaproteobacteria bacterium]|nr:DUF5086 family protein [Gammaproteobacteria bacterium]
MHQGFSVHRLSCLIFGLVATGAFGADLAAHRSGIWSIESTRDMNRWLVIHNLESAKTTRVYHIEVIGRKQGNAAWQVERLVRHMAITEKALKASVKEPLKNGSVYPESFYNAFAAWQQENNGKGGSICDTSVMECM